MIGSLYTTTGKCTKMTRESCPWRERTEKKNGVFAYLNNEIIISLGVGTTKVKSFRKNHRSGRLSGKG
jgi:hypothetical protein